MCTYVHTYTFIYVNIIYVYINVHNCTYEYVHIFTEVLTSDQLAVLGKNAQSVHVRSDQVPAIKTCAVPTSWNMKAVGGLPVS